jgi:general secretion pathway protein B
MSYILDALKKSEKERQRGTLPDMLTVQDIVADKPKKRLAWWAYLIAATIILNAGMFAWWLGFLHTEKAKVVQAPVVKKASLLNDVAQTVPDRDKSSPDSAQTLVSEWKPVAKNIVPATGSSAPASVNSDNSLPQSKGQTVPDIQRKTVPDKPASARDTIKQPVPAPGRQEQAESSAHIPSGPAGDHEEMPEDNKIYRLKELPSSIQQDLPSFSISALMYSGNPASRMVRINDQMMYEGQDLTAGVRLEEITKDGVIFRHQKYRFYVGVK